MDKKSITKRGMKVRSRIRRAVIPSRLEGKTALTARKMMQSSSRITEVSG